MKKIICALVIALLAGSVMAQTPEEKAAAKAAKAALKEATKAANKKLSEGMRLADQVLFCQQAIQAEQQLGEASNDRLIIENEAKIQELSLQGIELLLEALSTEYIKDNKKFDAYRALDNMGSAVLNRELMAYTNKEPYDRAKLGRAIYAVSEACHGQIAYGKEDDDMQNAILQSVKMKFPKTHIYYAYLCQFCIEAKDLDGAQAALDAYVSFPTDYPEVADHEVVKNPEYPASQFAYNIYLTAFGEKNLEVMNKYYDLALQFDGKDSRMTVLHAKPELYKQLGDTVAWAAALKDVIAVDHDGAAGKIAMEQLMGYYSNVGQAEVDAYTAELVEKYHGNSIANYCRGFAYYTKKQFTDAANYFQKAVDIDPNYADAVFNCGYCYYEEALVKARAISGKRMNSRAAIKAAEDEVKAIFAQAAPYFEKYRDMAPEAAASKWAEPLKVIYSNIGEKEKAAEMEAYIQ